MFVCVGASAVGWRAHAQDAPAAPERASVPSAPRVAGWRFDGALIDPSEALDAFVATVVPVGSFFVEAGPADRVGTPIGTIPRLQKAFDSIGYAAAIEQDATAELASTTRLRIHLTPYDRVRQVFVRGNWPAMRQEDILRRITLRPGQALPPTGPRRTEALEEERQRVLAFLISEGFLDAEVSLAIESKATVPSPVNLTVRLKLGRGYPLGKVTVRGNQAISTETIEDKLRHSDWLTLWTQPLPFKQSTARDDIGGLRNRYHELGYPAVSLLDTTKTNPREKRVDLDLTINERKKVDVIFEGNHCCLDSTLRGQITLFTNGTYDDYEITASCDALLRGYHERGYMLAGVTARRERIAPALERVVFVISEGPKLRVRSVAFFGSQSFSQAQLSDVVTTKTFPWIGYLGLGSGGYASPRQLELDVEHVLEFYRAAGFSEVTARAEIAPDLVHFRPLPEALAIAATDPLWRAAKALYVRFYIREGPRFTVSDIQFQTEPATPLPVPTPYLRATLLSTPGGPYRPALIRQDEERLRRLLGDAGFPYADVKAEISQDLARSTATVVWTLNTGPQVHVGPVFVRGNFLSTPGSILRWIPLRPGGLLTTTALERGQRNLALIQQFNNANPIRFPGQEDHKPVVPMLVQVEERHDHWGILHAGGGVSTEQVTPGSSFPFGAYVSGGYEHPNLFGRGFSFRTQGAIGNSLTRADVGFLDPRLLGTIVRLDVTATYLRQATVRLGDIESWSFQVGLVREVVPGLDAFVRYNLRNTLRTEFFLRDGSADARQQTVRLGTLVGALSTGADLVRLDNPLLPSRGFKLHGSLELAEPAFSLAHGHDEFLKTHVRSLVVVPLLGAISVRHSLRYEQGFPLGGGAVLPKVERFFAGGDTTLRGYELDRARTEIIRSPGAFGPDLVDYRPLGGSLRVLSNLDVQFPIAPPLYAGVFIDDGVVADSFDGLSAPSFRHGAGISPLLVRLPVGDISVSWGWPLDPQPGDSKIGRLHFNVGLMF